MSPKQNVVKSNISPVLFMTVAGEPMSFFLRPGAAKRKLQPLITAGGGLLCNVQQPGVILLLDPEERGSVPETTAHWYVSTQYIYDCIEKDEQMNLEDYKLNPEVTPRHSARLSNSKKFSPGLSGGRVAYTAEDDAAILRYVDKHEAEIGGNRLWQEMEKQLVTSHSWQSMKYRYKTRLAKKQPEAEDRNVTEEDRKAAEGETKDEENQEKGIEKLSFENGAVHPPHSPAAQPISTECMIENVEVPQSQTAESTQTVTVDAGTSDSAQPEEPCLDSQLDVPPIPAESAEPQSIISPQKDSMPEDTGQSLLETPSPIKRKVRRQTTRRQFELEAGSSEPYGKRLRSSSSAEKLSSSPRPLKKTIIGVKSAFQEGTTLKQLPSKRARKSGADSQQEEREEAAASETPPSDVECNSVSETSGEKKNQKRKMGILELAAMEFEDESESGEDITPDFQNPDEAASIRPTSTESTLPPSNTAANPSTTRSNPEPGPSVQARGPEAEDSSSNPAPETDCREPAPPGAAAAEAVHVESKAHLFIFDSESQEDDFESPVGENAVQHVVKKDAALSLTQVQLEEDMQGIRDLMNQTNQDLLSVTKALLKASGDFSAAFKLLLNPSSISGPFWTRCDDSLLVSGDPVARRQLQKKYGEEGLAKRIVFLDLEG